MRPTLRQIECFAAVVECGNFSRAAERIGTTQANLSHAVRDLEALLGTRLFDRTTRRVDLTEAGQAFARGALSGLAEIDRAAQEVRDLGRLSRGAVRIAAPPLLAAAISPRLLAEAARLHPGLEIRIEDVATDRIVEQIIAGRADLGVGTFAAGEPGLEGQSAVQDRLMAFFAAGHPLARRDSLSWADLAGERLIALTRESNIRLLVEFGFDGAGLPLRPALEVHQIHTALALAEAGAGVAVLPSYSLAARHGRPILALPVTDPAVVRDIRIVTARDRAPSPATQAIRPILRHTLRAAFPEGAERGGERGGGA
ncbi:MAG: LysR family transcriptional regulator [Rubellimicrobium sp.]|nr:LysR family transcriptional regulator [Rubellimicrobium sp.]